MERLGHGALAGEDPSTCRRRAPAEVPRADGGSRRTLYSPAYAPPAYPHSPVAPVSREAADASTPPMLKHWREVKAQHPETILFYRVGDFYEMFHEDAELAARILDITLTSRGDGVPLAGVPVKAAAEYLRQLVGAGHRVAICEQVEDPKLARGLVRREVVETVTPGAMLQEGWVAGGRNNLLVALRRAERGRQSGAGRGDRSQHRRVRARDARRRRTGRGARPTRARPRSSLPGDLPASRSTTASSAPCASTGSSTPTSRARSWPAGSRSPPSTGSAWARTMPRRSARPARCCATSTELQPGGLPHLARPLVRRSDAFLWLDEMTRRNLELVEPLRAGARGCTLLETIDATVTPMGGRLLRQWLLSPLRDPAAIDDRLDAVDVAVRDGRGRARLREALDGVRDVERLAGRAAAGPRHSPRARRAARLVSAAARRGRGAERARRLDASARRPQPRPWRRRPTSSTCWPTSPAELAARPRADRPPATLGDGERHPAGLRRGAGRAPVAPRRRPAVHRLAAAAGARAHRHLVAQGRLQQGVRLLPGDHQRPRRPGPGRLRAPADARHRRAVRHARAQGLRGPGARRRGADGRAGGRAVRRAPRRPWARRSRGSSGTARVLARLDVWTGAGRAGGERALRAAPGARRLRPGAAREPAPGDRADDAARVVHPQRRAVHRGGAGGAGDRAQHGGQVHHPSPDRAVRGAGPDGLVRAGGRGLDRRGGPAVHPGGRQRQPRRAASPPSWWR